jgi:hypothetical protein
MIRSQGIPLVSNACIFMFHYSVGGATHIESSSSRSVRATAAPMPIGSRTISYNTPPIC